MNRARKEKLLARVKKRHLTLADAFKPRPREPEKRELPLLLRKVFAPLDLG